MMIGQQFLPPCRLAQSQAKGNLRAIHLSEQSYRGEYDGYSADLEKLGFSPSGVRQRYRYAVTDVTDRMGGDVHFVAWAVRTAADADDADFADDVWRINETGALDVLIDGCARE